VLAGTLGSPPGPGRLLLPKPDRRTHTNFHTIDPLNRG
jgi:hypothetical protein